MGITIQVVDDPELMLQARKAAQDLPCWPHKNSVQEFDDFIIVKFSEDGWPDELV